jgi:hypothetical protein
MLLLAFLQNGRHDVKCNPRIVILKIVVVWVSRMCENCFLELQKTVSTESTGDDLYIDNNMLKRADKTIQFKYFFIMFII